MKYLCIATRLSPAVLLFDPKRGGRIFRADSTLRPISPLSHKPGFVCTGYSVDCTQQLKGSQKNGWLGRSDEREKQGFTAFFILMHFTVSSCFFRQGWAETFSSFKSQAVVFIRGGKRDVRESPEFSEDNLRFLFVSAHENRGFSQGAYLRAAGSTLVGEGSHVKSQSTTVPWYRKALMARVGNSCIAWMPCCISSVSWQRGNSQGAVDDVWAKKVEAGSRYVTVEVSRVLKIPFKKLFSQ